MICFLDFRLFIGNGSSMGWDVGVYYWRMENESYTCLITNIKMSHLDTHIMRKSMKEKRIN